jgi:hypothetical protein
MLTGTNKVMYLCLFIISFICVAKCITVIIRYVSIKRWMQKNNIIPQSFLSKLKYKRGFLSRIGK